MSKLIEHAKTELKRIGYTLDDKEEPYNKMMVDSVLELLKVFSNQGHSGFSAPYCISTFEKLARFEPLTPLTGEDSEWNEVSDDLLQNNRASNVFKRKSDGYAYDIDGKVFVTPNGSGYTNKKSHTKVTFPYVPKTKYVKVKE